MKEFNQKIRRLGEDIQVEIELRRNGIFKRDKDLEQELKPSRPFMAKLNSEALVGILIGTTIAAGTIWLIQRLTNQRKD